MSKPSQTNEAVSSAQSHGRGRFWRWWLNRLWYVHPGLDMIVTLSPLDCIRLLTKTSKPDVKRLELRSLFNGGRRYHIYTTEKGFVALTTSKVLWRYRGRTSPNAIVEGIITPQEGRIVLHLTAHIRIGYMLSSLLMPFFVTSMIFYMPWVAAIKILVILALFGLSWAGYRFSAALDAYETMHFIQQILKDYAPQDTLSLDTGQNVVYDAARFAQAWQTFYDHTLKQEI